MLHRRESGSEELSRRRGSAALSPPRAAPAAEPTRTPIGSRLSWLCRASLGIFDAAHQFPVTTRRRVLGYYANLAERPRMLPGGRRRSVRHAARPPRTRHAGRRRTPKLAPRLPRMRRAGRPRPPRLTVKEPRTRRATCPRRLIAMLGAPRDARFCPLSRPEAGPTRSTVSLRMKGRSQSRRSDHACFAPSASVCRVDADTTADRPLR